MSASAANHPLLVRELMTVGVPTCSPDTLVSELACQMVEKCWEAVVVLDPVEGHALGFVSQDELVKAYGQPHWQALVAEEIMRPEVPQVPPDIPATAAANLMQDMGVRVLFLTHHAAGVVYPAAMITYQHLLRHLAAKTQDELRDLGVHAERLSPVQAFLARRDEARKRNQAPPRDS